MSLFAAASGAQGQYSRPVRPIRRSGGDPSLESHQAHRDSPDDLLHLEDFNDGDLLRALWARYERKEIYTWVGSVLVSINPYKDIGAFREEIGTRYASNSPPQAPHLYGIVMAALNAPGDKHALLITGESGAGKTEATRAVLSFLAMRHTSADCIRDRLITSTPVLEAFGNAHTRQNTNSSRFGKFIEVHLTAEGRVIGATLQPYMLEASRVAGILPEGERTYHVFYLLRAALGALAIGTAPQGQFWKKLMTSSEWAELVRAGGAALASSRRLDSGPPEERSVARFEELVGGLYGAGMRQRDVVECCRLAAAVALLADMESNEDTLAAAAALLRIPEKEIRTFLTKVETAVGAAQQEHFYRARSEREATTLRASLAQELYAALFGWLTRLVARGIAPPKNSTGTRRLGLLDLYGFEVFASNGFEQFLINYCNERLQQLFNRQVFTSEAQEYTDEGLDSEGQWHRLMKACQLPALALLEGEPGGGPGLFGVINDRSRCGFEEFGKESNALADTIAVSCGAHQAFCRAGRDSKRAFGVKHFAGEVFYEAAQFVRKNASAHRPDIVAFLREHGGDFIREVLGGEGDAEGEGSPRTCGASSSASAGSAAAVPGGRRRKLFGRTLISVFQQELNELCTALDSRDCRHVRCLRPNDDQAPLVFDDASMLRQCRYSGLLEATRIRRQGYAHRRPLQTFAMRYAILLNSREARRHARHAPMAAMSAACGAICQVASQAGISAEDARIGESKVFLRESALVWFESMRKCVAAKVVSAVLMGNGARRQYLRLRWATTVMQAHARGWTARRYTHGLRKQLWAAQRKAAAEAAERAALKRAQASLERAHGAACQLQQWWRKRIALRRSRAANAARAAIVQEREAAVAAATKSTTTAVAAAMVARREREERRERRRRDLEREQRELEKQLEEHLDKAEDRENAVTYATQSPAPAPGASLQLGGQVPRRAGRSPKPPKDTSLKNLAHSSGHTTGCQSKSRRLLAHNPSRTPPPAMERRRAASQQPKNSTPRGVHRHYLQECHRLLAQHRRIRKALPKDQHYILGELAQAADFLSCNPPPVAYEDLVVVKERIQNLKAAVRSCTSSTPCLRSEGFSVPVSGISTESIPHHDSQTRLLQQYPSFPAKATSTVSSNPVLSTFFDVFGDRQILEPLQRSEPMQRSLSARSVYCVQSPRQGFRSLLQATPASARTPTTSCRAPLWTVSHAPPPVALGAMPRPLSHIPPLSTAATASSATVATSSSAMPVWAWQLKPPVVTSKPSSASATASKGAFARMPGPEVILSAIPTPARGSVARLASPMKVASSVTISYTPAPVPVAQVASVSMPAVSATAAPASAQSVHVVGTHPTTASLVPPARVAPPGGCASASAPAAPIRKKAAPALPMSPGVPNWPLGPLLPPGSGSRCCSPAVSRVGGG